MKTYLVPVFVLWIACVVAVTKTDLYRLLGITRDATAAEIKRAYRNKARDTHPDKQRNVDPEVAAAAFREIVNAYEILSDDASRKHYDRTGETSSQGQTGGGGNGRQQWSWSWSFNSGDRSSRQNSNTKKHRYLFDRVRSHHIRDAQSRTINIRNLNHLESVILDEDTVTVTERYTILAFGDSSSESCTNALNDEILFPWPFAGYNYENTGGMWWEEIVVNGFIDMSNMDQDSKNLADYFKILQNNQFQCPTILFIPRGTNISNLNAAHNIIKKPASADVFMQWVWPQLKMKVTFLNKTPWPVQIYWLDGNLGKKLPDIPKDDSYVTDTFISHSFYFRADFVEGYSLTNEV
jgi:curved DNA-binding protein CbpA